MPWKNLKWIKHKGKALGVWFSTNPEEALEANYADKFTYPVSVQLLRLLGTTKIVFASKK